MSVEQSKVNSKKKKKKKKKKKIENLDPQRTWERVVEEYVRRGKREDGE